MIINNALEELRTISEPSELWALFKICGKLMYFISNKGRFTSLTSINPKRHNGRVWKLNLITPYSNKKGYMLVRTRENGVSKHYLLHRLVLSAFNPIDTFEELQVNHIDGDKTNNNIENLEWCTCKENIQHAIENKLIDKTRKVSMYSLEGKFIKEFESITEAEKETGILVVNICACCNQKIRQAGGYQWNYNKFDNIEKVRPKKIAEDLKTRYCKPIQMLENGNMVKEFASVLEASNYLNVKNGSTNISACALGKRKSAYGYQWKYI